MLYGITGKVKVASGEEMAPGRWIIGVLSVI
jgi:hypothetical protein